MLMHDLDNDKYPEIKPITLEQFMRARDQESLDASSFPWEHKTLKKKPVVETNRAIPIKAA